jgi:hypothetical protein
VSAYTAIHPAARLYKRSLVIVKGRGTSYSSRIVSAHSRVCITDAQSMQFLFRTSPIRTYIHARELVCVSHLGPILRSLDHSPHPRPPTRPLPLSHTFPISHPHSTSLPTHLRNTACWSHQPYSARTTSPALLSPASHTPALTIPILSLFSVPGCLVSGVGRSSRRRHDALGMMSAPMRGTRRPHFLAPGTCIG